MGKLEGKIAIITGAASGMGAAQARLFVEEGAQVVLADLDERGADLAGQLGGNAAFIRHDVGSENDWAALLAFTQRSFGDPGVLINSAGIAIRKLLVETEVSDFERQFRANQLGTFLGIRTVVEPMKRLGSGAIVNISSVGGLKGLAEFCGYSSTKWGVRGISQAAALELAPYKIRVNTIFPGPIKTPMFLTSMSDSLDQIAAAMPAGRAGDPEEIARATLFLASDDARYVYGAELAVDGGQRI